MARQTVKPETTNTFRVLKFKCQNIRTEGASKPLLERRKYKYLQSISQTQSITLGGFVSGLQPFRSLTQYLLAFIVLLWVKYFKSFSEEMAHSSRQDRHRFVGMLVQAHFFSSSLIFFIRLRSGLCYNHPSTLTLVCLGHFTTA